MPPMRTVEPNADRAQRKKATFLALHVARTFHMDRVPPIYQWQTESCILAASAFIRFFVVCVRVSTARL